MSEHEDAGDPNSFLGYTIVRLAEVLQRRFERRLRERLGLSVRQFGALAHLKRDPGLGSGQLSRLLLITPQSAGPLVDSLERDGLVARDRGARSGTRMAVALTAEGEHALAEGYAIAAQANAEDLRVISTVKAREINAILLAALRDLSATG